MKKILVCLLILFQSNICIAEDPVFLPKGQPAPFEGFLITRQKVDNIRMMDLELQFQVNKNSILTQQLTLTEEQLKKTNEFSNSLSEKLIEMRDNSFWSKFGFFILGCATATVLAYGAMRVIK